MNRNWNFIKKNIQRNFAGNLALIFFILLSSLLVSSATIVLSQLFQTIQGLYEIASPPDFLQMHKGEIEEEKIDSFCNSYEGVRDWQSIGMINVYGSELKIQGDEVFSLEDCKLDISLVKQNKNRDLLLDRERQIVHLDKGEIAIPVILLDKYSIKKGDLLLLSSNGIQRKFVVSDFIYDAQMNSTMCSSTRILISDEDYQELFGKIGEIEYLIEVYFADKNMANDFQTAYENAELPQAGQAVTIKMIILLSAMTDIMLAMIFVFVSILLIVIAFMCMKYTILAAMEEDVKEIGAMKAIGISYYEIERLYLKKYRALISAGILLGYITALAVSKLLLTHINNTFGREPISLFTILCPIAVCFALYYINNAYCRKIFKKIKRLSVVDALVSQKGFGKKEKVKDGLHKSCAIPLNLLMPLRETYYNLKGFILIFIVMLFISSLVILPFNMLNTMNAKEFITYMGSSMDDIMIEIDSAQNLNNMQLAMEECLKSDSEVMQYKKERRVRVETKNDKGEKRNLHIDCGKKAGTELKYLDGRAPKTENEIALSKLNAEELNKKAGDSISVLVQGKERNFLICGIYQDVTSGGYTAKSRYEFLELQAEKATFTVNLQDMIEVNQKADIWKQKMGNGFEIEPMKTFLDGILGGVSGQVEKAAVSAIGIGIVLSMLITILFMKLRFARDCSQMAILKTMGFNDNDVRKQYLIKVGSVALAGILTGTVISNLFGDILVSAGFAVLGLGITKIVFVLNQIQVFFIFPGVLFLIVLGTVWFSGRQIKNYNIISFIQE